MPCCVRDTDLLQWLQSDNVLISLRQWSKQCIYNDKFFVQMQRLLNGEERPWNTAVERIVTVAMNKHIGELSQDEVKYPIVSALSNTASYATDIADSNIRGFFLQWPGDRYDRMSCLRASVRVLLLAFDDFFTSAHGFFATLVKTDLSKDMEAPARRRLE